MGTFSERMTYLYKTIRDNDSFDKLSKQPSIILFLSLGYRDKRAVVFSSNKASFDEAWESLYDQATQYCKTDSYPIDYLKIDWVDSQATISIPRFIEILTEIKKNHFRKGISFDPQFKYAFLEQEVNANETIQYNEQTGRAFLNAQNIKAYIAKNRPGMPRFNLKEVDSITIFTTQGIFLEKEQCYSLKNNSFNNGRRDTALTPGHLQEMILSSMSYLTDSNKKSGKFIYGYHPCIDKEIETYNMLRHGSTLYAMLEAYELFNNENTAHAIKRGLHFLVKHGIFIDKRKGLAYVVDQVGHKNFEVKLGANASAILAIVKYTEVFRDKSYLIIAQMLARGILRLQQKEGNFTHVLHFPSLAVKEAFRISNYDSEAALALLRLYSIDPDEKWLLSAEKTLDFFVKTEYWKKPDHWLSYCINEMVKYRPWSKYFKLGLQLVQNRLDFIDKQELIFPTFLEMTLATYELVHNQKEAENKQLLQEFPEEKLETVIHRRAEYQRNGYFYPEFAIYFENPKRVMGGFFSRYHSFRTRIDDVAHYLLGYCQYYKLFFAEDELKSEEPKVEQEKRKEASVSGQLEIGISLGKMVDFAKGQVNITEQSDIREADIDEIEKQPSDSEQQSAEGEIRANLDVGAAEAQPEQEVAEEEVPEPAEEPVSDDEEKEDPSEEPGLPLEKEVKETEAQEEYVKRDVEEEIQEALEKKTSEPEPLVEVGKVKFEHPDEDLEKSAKALEEQVVVDRIETVGSAESVEKLESLKADDDVAKPDHTIVETTATEKEEPPGEEMPLEPKEEKKALEHIDLEVTVIKEDIREPEQTDAEEDEIAEPAVTEEIVGPDYLEEKASDPNDELRKQNEEAIKAVHESEKLILTLANQVMDFSQRVEDLTNEVAALRKRSEELEAGSATTNRVQELSSQLDNLTKELTTLKNQSEELEKQASIESAATTAIVQELSRHLMDLKNELTILRNQSQELEEKQIATVEGAATTAQVQELSRQLADITNELTILRKQSEELEEKQVTFAVETASTNNQALEFSSQLADLTNELTTLKNQSKELKEKQVAAEKSAVTTTQVEELSHRLSELTNALSILRNQSEQLKEKQKAYVEASATNIQVQELSQRLADITNELTILRNQSEKLEEKQEATVESSATTARVEEISHQIAELTNALTILKNRSDELEEKQIAAIEAAATTTQVEELSRQLSDYLTNEITTLRNQSEEHKNQISREVTATNNQVLSFTQQLSELTNKLAILRRKSKELEEKQEATAESSATVIQVEELTRQIAGLTNELTTLRNQTNEHERQVSTEASAITAQVQENTSRLAVLTDALTTLKNQVVEHKKQASREAAAAVTQVQALSRQMAELTNALATVRKQSEQHEKEAYTKAASTTTQVQELARQIVDLTNELTTLRKQSEELKQALLKIEKDREEIILEGILKVTQIEGPFGIPELKTLIREILKQLMADGSSALVSAEQAQYKKQPESKSVERLELGDQVVKDEPEQPTPEELIKDTEVSVPESQDLPEKRMEESDISIEEHPEGSGEEERKQLEEIEESVPDLKEQSEEETPIESEPEQPAVESELPKKPKGLRRIFTAITRKPKKIEQENKLKQTTEKLVEPIKVDEPEQATTEEIQRDSQMEVLVPEESTAEQKQEPEKFGVPSEEGEKPTEESLKQLKEPIIETEEAKQEIGSFEEVDEQKETEPKEEQEDLEQASEFETENETKVQTDETKGSDEEAPVDEKPEELVAEDEKQKQELRKHRGLKAFFAKLARKKKKEKSTEPVEETGDISEKSEQVSELATTETEPETPAEPEFEELPVDPAEEEEKPKEVSNKESEIEEILPKPLEEQPKEQELQTVEEKEEPFQEVSTELAEQQFQEIPIELSEEQSQEIPIEFVESQKRQEKQESQKNQDPIWPKDIKPEDKVSHTGNLGEIEKLIEELEQSGKIPKLPGKPVKESKQPEVAEEMAAEEGKTAQQLLEDLDGKVFEQEWDSISGQFFEKYREEAGTGEKQSIAKGEQKKEPDLPPVTTLPNRKDKKGKRGKFLNILGNILIIFGLVVTAFFAYTMISTKIAEQKALEEAKNNLNLKDNPTEEPVEDPEAEAKKKEEMIRNYQAEFGEAFATVEIPKLQKTLPIIEGTDPNVLDRGVGHLKQSVFPGQNEQIVISGHRDTVFRGFEKLEIGDLFIVRMPYGTYTYEMRETEIVDEDDTSVVRSMGEEVLVVTTCYPFYYIGNAPQRFVIYAYPVENE